MWCPSKNETGLCTGHTTYMPICSAQVEAASPGLRTPFVVFLRSIGACHTCSGIELRNVDYLHQLGHSTMARGYMLSRRTSKGAACGRKLEGVGILELHTILAARSDALVSSLPSHNQPRYDGPHHVYR